MLVALLLSTGWLAPAVMYTYGRLLVVCCADLSHASQSLGPSALCICMSWQPCCWCCMIAFDIATCKQCRSDCSCTWLVGGWLSGPRGVLDACCAVGMLTYKVQSS
mgnify:CR=1 FL=1